MRSHRVNAGNDLGGQLGHDDHDDAGQQSGLQQKGLRVKLASWGVKPGRIRELGKGIRRRLFRGLLSTWQRRRPGTQQRPLWHCKEQEAMMMAVTTTWRPKRNLSMLSPLAAI